MMIQKFRNKDKFWIYGPADVEVLSFSEIITEYQVTRYFPNSS